MTDRHPDEDRLIELALDDIGQTEREEVLAHLGTCERCRSTYESIAGTIDRTLAAAPRAEPPPGFDGAVVSSLGLGPGDTVADEQSRPDRRRTRQLLRLAAAVIVGIAIGAGVAVLSAGDRGQAPVPGEMSVTANSTPLRTAEGAEVGTVTRSDVDGKRVVVVGVSKPVVGAEYRCDLLLDDGRRVVAGTWTMRTAQGWTWVVPAPAGDLAGVELVTESGKVWSRAELAAR